MVLRRPAHWLEELQMEQPEIIALEDLFGVPERSQPKLSPDGRYLTYLAPHNGVSNIWLRTVGTEDDHPLTDDDNRGIIFYGWMYNGEQVLYLQDSGGDENHHIFVIDLENGATRQLTSTPAGAAWPVKAMVMAASPERPDELLIGLNSRDERIHDLYLLNTRSGDMQLVQESRVEITDWAIDHYLSVRGYMKAEPDGGMSLCFRDGEGQHSKVRQWGFEDALGVALLGFGPLNEKLLMFNSAGRNAIALTELDPASGTERELLADPQYDVDAVITHPTRHHVEAASIYREQREWHVLDPEVKADYDFLNTAQPGEPFVVDATLDNRTWLVRYMLDDGPVHFYVYHRDSQELEFLFYNRRKLAELPLVSMQPVSYTARDGRTVHGYLSLPQDWEGPGPLVLNVHGGPWHRDRWSYHPEVQWLANRGYACLQVNFRGSTGYGKDHLNAGNREWGRNMQHDLSDAVKWAINEGIADPAQVVIYGGSYGGYATLAGVTFTPELYAAGVSLVGPSNMETFLNSIPAYWESFRRQMDLRVGVIPRYTEGERTGQPKDEADMTPDERAEVEFLRSRSPLFSVDHVRVPMLIAQGANDPRVKRAESDQFVEAMRAKGLTVEYIVYDDEGHGFQRPANRLDFYRRADKFLAAVLGGRCEEPAS
jgi:dipeptidyl aminopeptidase/acylaminoacyl peptidase